MCFSSLGKTIDLSDLDQDPIVRFQRQFYLPLVVIFWGLIPTYVPYLLWGETLWNSFFINVPWRYCYVLHNAWLVNSAAHLWGSQPYDVKIQSRDSPQVRILAFGEGYHNYHHTFPWDYSASELGWRANFNAATALIDFFATIGWAYDLRKPSVQMITSRMERTGENPKERKQYFYGWKDNVLGWLIVNWPIIIPFTIRWVFL